ncbi:MAG: type III-A CRISPR-associated RAMP protein Csm5 [Campylobacteraceae bacterium]|jgi:CRISPR/Cas system CSM-associated protein Csm3 (group 7 of RAMP superfamily)|nr:type III-A CRISPR-associated RAMP protein Csm5 [Campylobacteraceae bacterium]
MKTYHLKLTALSPIHIGTGQDYEPTNYVIDDGYLYTFDEIAFYHSLPKDMQMRFNDIVGKDDGNAVLGELYGFIRENKKYAKQIALNKVKVTNELEKKAEEIGKPVQIEGKSGFTGEVFNKFQIQQTAKLSDSYLGYIPGSSLKGSIATAFQEFLYKTKNIEILKRNFNTGNDYGSDKLFRNLSISDSTAINGELEIGYAINQERFEKEESIGEVQTIIEANKEKSYCLATLAIKELWNDKGGEIIEKISEKNIIEACNNHYVGLYKKKEEKNVLLKPNQFLICVGKYGGSRAVTIDGLRAIKVKMAEVKIKQEYKLKSKSSREPLTVKNLIVNEDFLKELSNEKAFRSVLRDYKRGNIYLDSPESIKLDEKQKEAIYCILKEETTVWKYNGKDTFGWLLCEFIDEEQYATYYDEIKIKENAKIKEAIEREVNSRTVIDSLHLAQQQKEEAKAKAAQAEQTKIKAEEERKASLSPLEKLIDNLISMPKNYGVPKITVIFKELELNNNYFGEYRCAAMKLLKEIMIAEKLWKEISNTKIPEKDKDYRRTITVMSWLKEME